jgi:hypothetical protein
MQTDIHSPFLFAGLNIHHHVWAAVYLPGKPPRWQGNRLPGRGPVRQVKHWRMRTFLLPGKLPRWQGSRLPRQEQKCHVQNV